MSKTFKCTWVTIDDYKFKKMGWNEFDEYLQIDGATLSELGFYPIHKEDRNPVNSNHQIKSIKELNALYIPSMGKGYYKFVPWLKQIAHFEELKEN